MMIEHSFIQIPGIGKKTEEYLWKKGVLTLDDLLEKANVIGLSENRRKVIEDYVGKAKNALAKKDAHFFSQFFPKNEYWRLYGDFLDSTLFLDIETTGLSRYYDTITVIGTFDGNKIKVFVEGYNMEEVLNYLQNFDVIVTFNGKSFDVPFIKNKLPEVRIPPLHIDLRFLLKSIGISGPLKEIEKKMDIKRPEMLQEIDGREAVILWRKFLRGDNRALEKLLLYNICDVVNLRTLMNECYRQKIMEIKPKIGDEFYKTNLIQKRIKETTDKKSDYFLDGLLENSLEDLFDMPSFLTSFTSSKVATHSSLYNLFEVLEINPNDKEAPRAKKEKIKTTFIDLDYLIRKITIKKFEPVSIGIDLSGSEKRNSGFCLLKGKNAQTEIVKTDEEIFSKVVKAEPSVISIDSPLSLPKGRDCPDDSCECRRYGIMRECERILRKRGIYVYPCLIKSMQKLTMRGIKLAELFEENGFLVIESYPGAAQDIFNIPRKREDLKALETGLKEIGINVLPMEKDKLLHDEFDALTSALVGYFYLSWEYEALGSPEEGYLIIPKIVERPNQADSLVSLT